MSLVTPASVYLSYKVILAERSPLASDLMDELDP